MKPDVQERKNRKQNTTKPKKRWGKFLTATACVTALALPAWADINLVFGTYAADKPSTTVMKFKPFLSLLSQEMTAALGEQVNIKMKISKEYGESITHLVDGKVDFTRFGPASYIIAQQKNSGIEIVAVESNKGKKIFKGVIAVHKDSDIQTLSELSGLSFAFGDKMSTIGRYLSQSHLINAGITSKQLSGYEYLGRHDRVGSAVGEGRYAAGALKESTFQKLVKSGVPIRKLFEFDNVTKPWIASSEMDPTVLAAMRKVMLNLADTKALANIAKNGFLAGDDSDYDFIRKAMKHSSSF